MSAAVSEPKATNWRDEAIKREGALTELHRILEVEERAHNESRKLAVQLMRELQRAADLLKQPVRAGSLSAEEEAEALAILTRWGNWTADVDQLIRGAGMAPPSDRLPRG